MVLFCSNIYAEQLIIGLRPFNPPFSVTSDNRNHFFGFEVDIISEVCKRIKATCRFKGLSFAELFSELLTNQINLAISAIVITDERKKDFLFSIPYLDSAKQFVVMSNSKISSIEEIKDRNVGCEKNTSCKNLVIENLGGKTIVTEYPTLPDVFKALSDNKIDAVLTYSRVAKYWVSASNNILRLVGKSLPGKQGYGIMANKNKTELITKINQALHDMGKDGTYKQIFERYFLE